MPLEVERKYLRVDWTALRGRLRDLGADNTGAHFESNWILDAPGGALFCSDRLLRLRTQEWGDRTRHFITLKLPAQGRAGFKTRDEREVEVADCSAMGAILEGLGYAVCARYEKVRELWLLEGVAVALDVLPFGNVVELEGDAGRIDSLEKGLGLDKAERSTKSYHGIYQEWLRVRGLPPSAGGFVFDGAARVAWRRKLGLGASGDVGGIAPPVATTH